MSVKTRVKRLVEKSLGVTISRGAPAAPNQHADEAIRRLRRWSSDDVVFDVGANDGRTVLRIVHQLCLPRIYAFEPVSSTFETLVRRTAHLGNVRCLPLALGASPGKETIYLNEIASMNSFSPQWVVAPQSAKTETVEVSTVDRVMAEQGIDFVHFLKIDTEGYELEVLAGARRALDESRIGLIQVEVGVGQSEKDFASLEQVRSHLAPMGYRLYGIYNQCRARARVPEGWAAAERDGYDAEVLVYCDALFLRADLKQ